VTGDSGNPHGSYVNLNELALILDETRVLRLALNVLYDGMDHVYAGAASTPAGRRFQDVMADVHDRLAGAETRALTQCGFAEHYVVIRPFSPLSLPDESAIKEITSAIRTLQRHGMLVQAPDARDRDDEC
jgi:hypothetical protein